jgi:hypothetical protein
VRTELLRQLDLFRELGSDTWTCSLCRRQGRESGCGREADEGQANSFDTHETEGVQSEHELGDLGRSQAESTGDRTGIGGAIFLSRLKQGPQDLLCCEGKLGGRGRRQGENRGGGDSEGVD